MGNISLKTNDETTFTFKYGNCAKNSSKKSPGQYYYTFVEESGDKLHCNAHLLNAIRQNWPGRTGTINIVKLNDERYDITVVREADRVFDLELTQWSDQENKYVECGAWPGSGGEETKTAPAAQPYSGPSAPVDMGMPPPQAKSTKTWEDVEALYAEALGRAAKVWFGFDWKDVPGDQCGAVERMAVSMAIEANRAGLRPLSSSDKFIEQMEQKDAPEEPSQMDKAKEAVEAVMGPTETIEDDDLPF